MRGDSESDHNRQMAGGEMARPRDDPGTDSAIDQKEPMPLMVAPQESRAVSHANMMNEGGELNSFGTRGRPPSRCVWLLVFLVVLGIITISSGISGESIAGRSIQKTEAAFNVDGPPGNEERFFRPEGKAPTRPKRAKMRERKEEEKPNVEPAFPVIDQSDDEIPTGKSSFAEGVAEQLECRKSVIDFVINATDAKDECNGLKKAFDKTCNSDSVGQIMASADAHPSADPQRRRLFEKRMRRDWKLRLYQIARSLHSFTATYLVPVDNSFFFAEDEILGDAWEEAQYQVRNDYDFVVHEGIRRRLIADGVPRYATPRARFVQELELLQNATNATETPKKKPSQSLSLPTSSKHVSDQMLSETLMLQTEKDIAAAIMVSNQTNATLNEAQSDAVASSKALHDTTAAVSALLNDPTSVEARTCCASILNVYHEHCDTTEDDHLSDSNLFIMVFIIAFCGLVKSLIRHFQIRWLPEAAGCILVGALFGGVLAFFPNYDLSFNGDWFLRIMVPPIVFEAALSIDKKSFQKHIIPIMVYAVVGTLFASAVTAFILHKGTMLLGGLCETIPYVESLTFGALISSIDPIAVLSVLSNLGMTDTDTIYVVIFGESLLNDGVAMVLFETLVHFLDESLVIDGEAVIFATMHFLVVALGSVFVGFVSGMACTCYFYAMKGCQTALVEVLLFFCWALVPYYICDGVEWSGIVSIVTTGIVMDLYVVGQSSEEDCGGHFVEDAPVVESVSQRKWDRKALSRRLVSKKGHLSSVARTHVGFVTEILSTMMETSIFAYLGFFLLSSRYHWNFWHVMMALIACCLSRAIMIPSLSLFANWITSMRQSRANCCAAVHQLRRGGSNFGPGVIIDFRMQTVLWFAGLRGAMSFALVENIPLYDAVTGEGSRMKAELKAMTSASIIFTVFILGGCTDYIIERLGMAPSSKSETVEMTSLLGVANGINGEGRARERIPSDDSQPKKPRTTSRQRRGLRVV